MIPPTIEHRCDVIEDDAGRVVQVYNHLIYRFGEPAVAVARAYLDDIGTVALLTAGEIPAAVLAYLDERFAQVEQLGKTGYAPVKR